MTTYTWPGWAVSRFEMRVMPNTRVFTGSYTPNVQAVEVQPRTRQAVPSGQTVALAAPVAAFILKPGTDSVPTTYVPGFADGAEVEFVEAL